MEQYFNHYPGGIDSIIFGTSMLLAPPFDYFADDYIKYSIDNHARKQTSLDNSLCSTVVTGVRLCNWSNGEKPFTLLRDLVEVQSIINKKWLKAKARLRLKEEFFTLAFPIKIATLFTILM